MNVEKWWNEICGRGKREKPREKPTRPRFVHHETHMEESRRELGTPAVGGERLTACATRLPNYNNNNNNNNNNSNNQFKILLFSFRLLYERVTRRNPSLGRHEMRLGSLNLISTVLYIK